MDLESKVDKLLTDGCNNKKVQDMRIERVEKDYNGLGKKVEDYRDKFELEYKSLITQLDNKTKGLHNRINVILLFAIGQLCALVMVLVQMRVK